MSHGHVYLNITTKKILLHIKNWHALKSMQTMAQSSVDYRFVFMLQRIVSCAAPTGIGHAKHESLHFIDLMSNS